MAPTNIFLSILIFDYIHAWAIKLDREPFSLFFLSFRKLLNSLNDFLCHFAYPLLQLPCMLDFNLFSSYSLTLDKLPCLCSLLFYYINFNGWLGYIVFWSRAPEPVDICLLIFSPLLWWYYKNDPPIDEPERILLSIKLLLD